MELVNDQLTNLTSEMDLLVLYRTNQHSQEEEPTTLSPSKDSYGALIFLYDYFNTRLFNNTLPPCLITLPRRSQWVGGYFWPETWTNASHTHTTDEIALNPIHFQSYSTEFILSILVHEMVHLQQHHFGKPGRGRYHNKQWARMMRQVGLIPSDSGTPDGKETGDTMSHYVAEGGAFQGVFEELLQRGFAIPWHTIPPIPSEGRESYDQPDDKNRDHDDVAQKKRASKTKYTCSECGLNVWAKPGVRILCVECQRELVLVAS